MQFGQAKNRTTSGEVNYRPTNLVGFYVNSTTAGTIVFHDAGGATNAVTGTITPAIGWHFLPIAFGTGCHVVFGGTLDATFVYQPT